MVSDTPMEQGNRFPSTPDPFLDADEDFRPLTASWGDIMEQEDRAATTAVPTACYDDGRSCDDQRAHDYYRVRSDYCRY